MIRIFMRRRKLFFAFIKLLNSWYIPNELIYKIDWYNKNEAASKQLDRKQ
jgi:hypothetical protein